jgi:cysteine desulfurase/selenocysteine lyase
MLARIRSLFPVTREKIYFNHASNGPLSRPARQALIEDLRLYSRQADYDLPEYFRRLEKARTTVASLVGANPEEITFTPSTSYGVFVALCNLNLERGDRLLVMDEVFPTVRCCVDQNYPHVDRRYVKFGGRDPIDAVRGHLTRKTRAVVVDWVNFFTGEVLDLDRLGKYLASRRVKFVVDGMQGLGALKIDVRKTPVDFMAGGGNKWLFSTQGIGYLYVNRKNFRDLKRTPTGWLGLDWPNFDSYKKMPPIRNDARRFEMGTRNALGAHALTINIGILEKFGLDRVEAKIQEVKSSLRRGLTELGYEILTPANGRQSGIITARPKGDPAMLYKLLTANRVVLSLRNQALRFSPHFYNNAAEARKVIAILEDAG